MIKVCYKGYGYRDNGDGTRRIEVLILVEGLLLKGSEDTLDIMGSTNVFAFQDMEFKSNGTVYYFTDMLGNLAPFTISKDQSTYKDDNGNALRLIFDDAPPVDIAPVEKDLSPSKEKTYLNTIGALLEYINGDITGVKKHPSFSSETDMIAIIEAHYKDRHKQGLSETTLKRKFAAAKAKLNEKN